MSEIQARKVDSEEEGIRLDRWFKRHFPALTHGRLEKLLRTGQVRIDGTRAKSGTRLQAGQMIRVPPLEDDKPGAPAVKQAPRVSDRDAETLQKSVLYMDDEVIAIDKPAGLAVQGGTKTHHHLDAMLDALRFDARERPKLVHRLDRDTSGVLLLARSSRAASELAGAFKSKTARKIYWAAVVGLPKPREGVIDLPLEKMGGPRGEMVAVDEDGLAAVTNYRVADHAGARVSWLVLEPLTGRTHQLRVHCAAIGTPILGDAKYGGREAFPAEGIANKLHLHARSIRLPRPGGRWIEAKAPLPPHMRDTWRFLGFDPNAEE